MFRFRAASRAIVSWTSTAAAGTITLTALRADGSRSAALPYVTWSARERRSLAGADTTTRIATDVVESSVPLHGIEVSADVALELVTVATPPLPRPDAGAAPADAAALDVPQLSQYVPTAPHECGWCSAAVTAMLLGAWEIDVAVDRVAADVYDAAYGGTGNWTFNTAYAGQRGLHAAVVMFRDLDHAGALVAAGFPVGISIAWAADDLPGAPLPTSAGHLLVLRGLAGAWALVNDPAQPQIAHRYPRAALDRVFRTHGGIGYLVAPPARWAAATAAYKK